VADVDAATVSIFVGELDHAVDVHRLGRVAEVEMQVDVEVVGAGELENATDLPHVVGVVTGRAADCGDMTAALDCLDEESLGTLDARHALLQEDADLEIDGPAIVPRERLDGLETDQAAAGVDLDVIAHPRRALKDRGLERRLGSRIDVLDGELALDRLDAL